MSYVTPNSTLQLFKGINLDNRYLHTIYFASETAQDTWFTGKVFKTFNNLMYRRYQDNVVRIQADATELLGTTYMRFKNTRTASKWFYAFVLGVDYVNENTADVYYEIDVMQTWFIQNGSIRPCMVLREHVNDDTLGAHLEAEPIGSDVYDSDYITKFGDDEADTIDFGEYSIVAQTTDNNASNDHYTQGLFCGSRFYAYPCRDGSDAVHIYNTIQGLLGSWSAQEREEDLVDLYTVPSWLIDYTGDDNDYNPEVIKEGTANGLSMPAKYDNYIPKNKKLFTYPYSYLTCTTHTGDGGIYKWEYFDEFDPSFRATGTFIGGGEIKCVPLNYNGQTENVDSALIMNNFPNNAYAYDAYEAWIASGGTKRLENERLISSIRGVAGLIPSVGGIVRSLSGGQPSTSVSTSYSPTGNYYPTASGRVPQMQVTGQRVTETTPSPSYGASLGFVGSAMNNVAGLIEAKNKIQYTFNDAMYTPNMIVGKQTSNLAVALRDANFYFYHTHVRDSEAKKIDDFFSTYGYNVHKVKQPNLTGRRYWNFVQTQDAVIAGDMPSSSKEAIGRIFDGGITFWHDGDQVGNYAQSVSEGSINNPII